ncbi:hypothetical protein [Gephyromycinifex aptenodytis]|uniref:hypothetical protein n=1 Tax=Gephyromycinifex aptenodytis TaxID=2716227 RepID=UPI0014460886|nr:hypothetical protein [Gephyromycinifex aptenodytis]
MPIASRSRIVHPEVVLDRFGSRRTRAVSIVVAVLPLVAVAAGAALFFVAEPAYHASVAEDGPVEWATAAVYLLLCPVAALVAWRRSRRGDRLGALALAVLAVGFLLIAGEEVSWGQRQLGFAGPPELVERNIQGEANLHNLLGRYALHMAYIAVGLWGLGLGRVIARLIPAARPTWLYAPRRVRFTWFIPVTAYYLYVDYLGPALLSLTGPWFQKWALGPARFQELIELILAIGFALFSYDALRRTEPDGYGVADDPYAPAALSPAV